MKRLTFGSACFGVPLFCALRSHAQTFASSNNLLPEAFNVADVWFCGSRWRRPRDLVILDQSRDLHAHQSPNGTFTDYPLGNVSGSINGACAWGFADNDGHKDVFGGVHTTACI